VVLGYRTRRLREPNRNRNEAAYDARVRPTPVETRIRTLDMGLPARHDADLTPAARIAA